MTLDEARERMPAIYVIYDHPLDFPDYFVVRCWYGLTAEPHWHLAATAEQARAFAHRNGAWHLLPVGEGDDPKIMESWI